MDDCENTEEDDFIQSVLDKPEDYKICEVCRSIIDKSADICPDCYAYRFNCDAQAVADYVLDFARMPSAILKQDEHYEDY